MYRIFCESYKNFLETLDKDNYRLRITKPFELIVDIDKFKKEKKNESEIYKKLCNLIFYMQKNIKKFPRLKALLWTLESRDIKGKNYDVSNKDELEEQTKLVNSFLKLAYWY